MGKGDFVGYTTKTFTINTVDVNDCKVSSINSVPYSGKEIQPDVAVAMDGYTLAKDVDYTVEYQNNLNVGIGIVVIKGIGNFTGRNICLFDITRCDISTISKIVVKNCEYSGKAAVPEMILENNGIALVKDKDYTVTFKITLLSALPLPLSAVLAITAELLKKHLQSATQWLEMLI